ncbi:PREDICTED: zinc finger protein 845-like [Ceratosolen solmsi marchali]|uniref:Zinc finger protein 845-like n=1 Tax=Ceratosolen solmsi marchali TaxID=326594 RepID=A0AAJ7DZI5_9HYME|nr:PREDICTED: zinc finger protein 845-like [Ceratosolen solmsi marchali]
MSSLDYLDLCRLCLVKDRVSVPIFEDEGDVRQIFLKITACLPVKVSREDKLPKKICDDCVYKVELFYQFWNTTANAEKQLLQWLGEVGGLEDNQSYVTEVLDSNVMKQERNSDNRLDGSVMQVGGHQNNIDIGIIDNMSLITLPTGNEQFTTVPMDTTSTVQTVQAVPGSSTQTSHDQIAQNQATVHLVEEDEESEEDDNSDEGCDNEEGLAVKEETEEDQSDRPLEPTTFVNVAIPCDEAGPSGLQQQKISEISEISMPQSADGDPKTGSVARSSGRGLFIFERESLVMRKWQILEFDGNPYYAFVPEDNDVPIEEDSIPELSDDVTFVLDEQLTDNEVEDDRRLEDEGKSDDLSVKACSAEASNEADEDFSDEQSLQTSELMNVKPVIVNGKLQSQNDNEKSYGDLYQVKVEAGVVTLEKLDVENLNVNQQQSTAVVDEAKLDKAVADGHDVTNDEGREEAEMELDVGKRGPGTPALKCKACSETFESTMAFRRHVAWTHKKKVCIQENGAYICSVCDYRSLKKSLFAAHLQRKHETWSRKRQNSTNAFPCGACGFVCRSKHSLQSHFIRKHTDDYEHQCKFCPKKFKVKGDLTNHVRFHHKEKPVNCDVCGKLCLNSGSLYVHQKWAHYKPKFECMICKRRMVTQENLDQHMIMQHEKREKIVCAECGKTFSKKDSFKRHMAVHTGNKPYVCIICNKPFARRSQLRQHLLIHTGKRPFVCDICGKAFTQKPGLICHRKTHPGTHPPLPVMPIGDIVKEFTEGYLAINPPTKIEDEDQDDPDEEEEEEEVEEGEMGVGVDFGEENEEHIEEVDGMEDRIVAEEVSVKGERDEGRFDEVLEQKVLEDNMKNAKTEQGQAALCRVRGRKALSQIAVGTNATKNRIWRRDRRQRGSRTFGRNPGLATSGSKSSSGSHAKLEHNLSDRCDTSSVSPETLRDHGKCHDYRCEHCQSTFRLRSQLREHIMEVHESLPRYVCAECENVFKCRQSLREHLVRKHTEGFRFACAACGSKFKVKSDMYMHVQTVHNDEREAVCDVCGKKYRNAFALKKHLSNAHNRRPFACDVCKRRLATKESLEQHTQLHLKKERAVCQVCGKTFRDNDALKKHMRIHTGVRPFPCKICGKAFRRQNTHKQHLLTHTGVRPYVCDICGKNFTQKPGLITHRKKHPGPLPPLPSISIDYVIADLMQTKANATGALIDDP